MGEGKSAHQYTLTVRVFDLSSFLKGSNSHDISF